MSRGIHLCNVIAKILFYCRRGPSFHRRWQFCQGLKDFKPCFKRNGSLTKFYCLSPSHSSLSPSIKSFIAAQLIRLFHFGDSVLIWIVLISNRSLTFQASFTYSNFLCWNALLITEYLSKVKHLMSKLEMKYTKTVDSSFIVANVYSFKKSQLVQETNRSDGISKALTHFSALF